MKVKVFIICMLSVFICPLYALAEDEFAKSTDMFIAQCDGVYEISDGNISFDLPDLNSRDYTIYAVQLAIFEKKQGESEYSIYKDKDGAESKKQIVLNPNSLHINISLGYKTDYRLKADYKAAYRYYMQAVSDESIILIAGEEKNDGWRLIGEADPTKASENGFRFRVNAAAAWNGIVKPTDAYQYTVYKTTSNEAGVPVYIMKSTAFATQYTLGLEDRDYDIIKLKIKLVSDDDNSIYTEQTITDTGVELLRNTEFIQRYIKNAYQRLPDGVYSMYLTISELYGTLEIPIATNEKGCEVVIKRALPPEPVIDKSIDNIVTIVYPSEILAQSLQRPYLTTQQEYRFTPDEAPEGSFLNYSHAFNIDKDGTVEAVYTDIAGNQSKAEKHVLFNENGRIPDVVTDGNTASMESDRAADTIFINTRRRKEYDIDRSIFKFIK